MTVGAGRWVSVAAALVGMGVGPGAFAQSAASSTVSGPRPDGGPPPDLGRRFGDYAQGPRQDWTIRVQWNGYLRLVAEAVQNDRRFSGIGRNDGFKVANARLGVRAETGRVALYISVDGTAGRPETFNDADETFAVLPRDMLLRYRLAEFADVTVGRFKAPYDLGELETTPYRMFIDLPLESRGVLPNQGFTVEGLGQGRQLGAMVGRDRIGLSDDGFDIGYAVALTNGRTLQRLLNDNDRVAGFARLALYWGEALQVNAAGFIDTVVGVTRAEEDVKGLEASVLVEVSDFNLEAQLLVQHFSAGATDAYAVGAHGQVAYRVGGFQAAYRLAWYDPRAAAFVVEHTLGLNYTLSSLPVRLLLNGTLAQEDSRAARTDNNRLTFLTQFMF